MLKKLALDALMADLESVDALLAARTEEDDPIGFYQFSARKAEIEDAINKMENELSRHAEIGIFFGGQPVQGSRGINADFADKALDEIQGLISTRFSGIEIGPPKQRGPVILGNRAQMIVTSVMRGSFGFVLEEAGQNEENDNTPLRDVVEEVSNILSRVGAADETIFEEAASELDERFLIQLRHFFQYLDEQAATMRIVSGHREFLLDRNAITLARTRIQGMEISEDILDISGDLFFLPESKRFDFVYERDGARAVMRGSVAPGVFKQIAGEAEFGNHPIEVKTLSQNKWQVEIKSREIRERLRPTRYVYSLIRLKGIAI